MEFHGLEPERRALHGEPILFLQSCSSDCVSNRHLHAVLFSLLHLPFLRLHDVHIFISLLDASIVLEQVLEFIYTQHCKSCNESLNSMQNNATAIERHCSFNPVLPDRDVQYSTLRCKTPCDLPMLYRVSQRMRLPSFPKDTILYSPYRMTCRKCVIISSMFYLKPSMTLQPLLPRR